MTKLTEELTVKELIEELGCDKIDPYKIFNSRNPKMIDICCFLIKQDKIMLSWKNDIYAVQILIENNLNNFKENNPKAKFIIKEIIDQLEKDWNNDWHRALELLSCLYHPMKFPEELKRLKSLISKTDLKKEKSHYDWAEEYIPRSPLFTIKKVCEYWGK